jgi:hypothetical protein
MLAWCQFDQLQPTQSVATHSKSYAGHPQFVNADQQMDLSRLRPLCRQALHARLLSTWSKVVMLPDHVTGVADFGLTCQLLLLLLQWMIQRDMAGHKAPQLPSLAQEGPTHTPAA